MSISPQSGARGSQDFRGKYGEGSRLYYIELWSHAKLYCFFLNNKIYSFLSHLYVLLILIRPT